MNSTSLADVEYDHFWLVAAGALLLGFGVPQPVLSVLLETDSMPNQRHNLVAATGSDEIGLHLKVRHSAAAESNCQIRVCVFLMPGLEKLEKML